MNKKTVPKNLLEPYSSDALPEGIRSRYLNVNGLRMHILEAGYELPECPCLLLIHGFPELAYSWRYNMLPLAAQGYHVIAPDLRGYGRTTGWTDGFDVDLTEFTLMAHVRDMAALVAALGYRSVYAVIGHDVGSFIASYAALIRPDIFQALAMLGAPFPGPPKLPIGVGYSTTSLSDDPVNEGLAALDPPRMHYQLYFAQPEAEADMHDPPQGIHALLRAYFHFKSADWKGNVPFPLKSWTAEELAQMPEYYIMQKGKSMAETVAEVMPDEETIQSCSWMTEKDLSIYSSEYDRAGFQGSLNFYRCAASGLNDREMRLFAGRKIEVPALFIGGSSDWCPYQNPTGLRAMAEDACPDLRGSHFVDGAGHWVQQEQPEKTNQLLINFIRQI